MGGRVAARRLQSRPYPDRRGSHPALDPSRGAACRRWPPRRGARASADERDRCETGPARAVGGADHLALPHGDRSHLDVRRLDLHALGCRDRHPARRCRLRRLVLAEGRQRLPRTGDRLMAEPRFTTDLAPLPTHAFGHRSSTWWGIIAFFLIQGTLFLPA